MLRSTHPLPSGYKLFPEGNFIQHSICDPGRRVPLGMKRTPVTNAEWLEDVHSMLGRERYVGLNYDHRNYKLGRTMRISGRWRTAEKVIEGVMDTNGHYFQANPGAIGVAENKIAATDFDAGEVLSWAGHIFFKMMDDPSAKYDKGDLCFSGPKQPVVGITYYHKLAWCHLKTLQAKVKELSWIFAMRFTLPTYSQYKYITSKRDRELRGYLPEFPQGDEPRTTLNVDHPIFAHELKFGVQTRGNVQRRLLRDTDPERPQGWAEYGVCGGSFRSHWWSGDGVDPDHCAWDIGFQPVIVNLHDRYLWCDGE